MVFSSRKTTTTPPPRRRQPSSGEVRTPHVESDDTSFAFRRNRTLTGSPSSHVRGAVEHSAQMKSGRIQAHELSLHRRRIGGIFSIVAVISILLLIIVLNFTAKIAIDTPDVNQAINTGSYAKTINDYLAYRPVERVRLFTNNTELTRFVMHEHPEVESVKVDGGGGFATSTFQVVLRKPLASWTINGERYYVDAKGVSFQINHFAEPPIRVVDDSGVPVEAGVSIASNRFLSYVGRTISDFQRYTAPVEKVTIPFATTRQIEVTLKGKGYPVRLSIDRVVGEQVEDAVRAVRYIDSQGKNPQYVDVRVSGKAFYQE